MRNKILVVDDAELNRELLAGILEDDYEIEMAEDGEIAIQKLYDMHEEILAVLLDLQMPKKDGFAVIDEMKKQMFTEKIPVLIISGECSVEIENKCFMLGVSDFIHKPFEPSIVRNRIRNSVELFMYKNRLEDKVEEQTHTLRKQNELLQQQAETLRKNNTKLIDVLGTVVETRNLESGQHIMRVKEFTRILARQVMADYPEYQLNDHMVKVIATASALHDVGKIGVKDEILLKPGRFTPEERKEMEFHTVYGADIISKIQGIWDDEYKQVSYEICRYHHERYDGRGYPDGLTGDEIPISAQIVSVADVYDALVSKRCYKDAYEMDRAFQMILAGECGVFSPKLMECLKKCRADFEELALRMR